MSSISTNGTINATNMFINSNQVLHTGNYSSYALPLSGGTMVGNITFKSSYDVKASNNGSSSTQYSKSLLWHDTNDLQTAYIQTSAEPTGNIVLSIGARNYDTSGNRVGAAGLQWIVQKDGEGYLKFSHVIVGSSSTYGSSLPSNHLIAGRIFYKLV